jgi:hypothetical protein
MSITAPDVLPSLVSKTVELFMDINGEILDTVRACHIRDISATVVTHCPSLATLLIKPTVGRINDFACDKGVTSALLFAIALQRRDLVLPLLKRGASSWDRNQAFRRAFDLAVVGLDIGIFQ